MKHTTTITGTINQTVSLGTNGIAATLTVTSTGLILPLPEQGVAGTYGDIGVEVRPHLSGASITNMGTISGGAGGTPGGATYRDGGIGVNVVGLNATIANGGLISGGAGAYVAGYAAKPTLAGGIGIDLNGAGFALSNTGTILGGHGSGGYFNNGGTGGAGVDVAASGMLTNGGTIVGGAGGSSKYQGTGGNAGVGLDLAASGASATNNGEILGGAGGRGGYIGPYFAPRGLGGNGANVSAADHLVNAGKIGGNIGLAASQSASIINTGAIYSTGVGVGVDLQSAATLANAGVIFGGVSGYGEGAPGPVGVNLGKDTGLTNTGTIIGGQDGRAENYNYGPGGAGVAVSATATMDNKGLVVGGYGFAGGQPGQGGVGVDLGGTLTNESMIVGGVGGGGVGATRAYITNAGTISGGAANGSYPHATFGLSELSGQTVNTGTIEGGSSLTGAYAAGIGVAISQGTLTNAGTISGGVSGGRQAYALNAYGGATIILDPGAVFNGVVHANGGTSNAFELAGTTAGTLSGIDSEFIGFTTLAEAAGANWTLAQSNALGAGMILSDSGKLIVSGSLIDAGQAKILAGGTLGAASGGTLLLESVALTGGVLAGSQTGSVAIGGNASGLQAGHITVEAGANVSGSGAINGAYGVIDDGTIIARAGTLTIGVPVSGTGALHIANAATLQTGGAVSVASVVFNAGTNETLYLAKPAAMTGTISGFGAGDTIDLKGIAATTLTFLAGTLTLYDGTMAVDALTFAGDYVAADFTLKPDGAGGTDILYSGAAPESQVHAGLHPEPIGVAAMFQHVGDWRSHV